MKTIPASSHSLFTKSFATLLGASALLTARASTDYGPARWMGVCGASESTTSGNWYTSGYGKRFFVIHDIEGYYQNFIYNSRHCIGRAGEESVHYATNGKQDSGDPYAPGDIAQMVRDAYYAWHARCWNQYSMGNEHEGFVSNPAWFTEALYVASASLTRAKCNKYNIPKDRNHIIAHGQKNYSWWRTWMSNQGYGSTFINCNTHSDPGPYWDWSHYMDLVNGINSKPSRPTSLTAKATSWSKIDLKWSDNSSNEQGFEIQKSSGGSDGPWNTIHSTSASVHAYTASGLSGNNTYWFRVRAFNAQGNSDWSNVAHDATFSRYPPVAPTGLTAVANNDDKITLTWTDNSDNEDQFNIQQSIDGTAWTLVKETSPNATSFAVTGLKGNRTYYFRVKAVNEAGGSAWSNTASDITPPTAPDGLIATKRSNTSIRLTWNDNSGAEAGFKIERSSTSGTSGFSQIATNAPNTDGSATYTDTGLTGGTTYWYRVRSYNANGNSAYSNVDSATTDPDAPVITPVGNKTVAAGSAMSFRVSSTDPNQTTGSINFADFGGYTQGQKNVLFKDPDYVNATSSFIDTSVTNYCYVDSTYPAGHSSTFVLHAKWNFKTGQTNPYMQLSTDAANITHPTIQGKQSIRFDIHSDKDITVGFSFRETGTSAAYGADGGSTGPIEWVGVTNEVSGHPFTSKFVAAGSWQTITLNCQKDPVFANTGDGEVAHAKGVMANFLIVPRGTMGAYNVFFDNFKVYTNNTLTFSLLSPPSGMTINAQSGDIQWTPTTAQVGSYNVSVKVVDQLGLSDTNTFKVTVSGVGNTAPVLAAIGSKTVKEGTALTFTASATDADAGQMLSYSLDAGNPSGSSINSSSGAFTWTPTEAQGPGSYPITVRVTDNGSPSSNDFETISVTVSEVNTAPVIPTIANQTVNEGSTFNYTVTSTDADAPANAVTYSFVSAPVGMTMNTNTGAISWVTAEKDGPDTVQVTVRVTDNGVPKLWSDRTFNVIVNELNTLPSLTVSNTASTTIDITDFENYQDGSYNGTIMFRQPSYSGSTSSFLDTALADEATVTTNSPGTVRSSVLQASFAFKTGQTNPWLRFTTFNPFGQENALPNPTIDFGKHLTFDIYSDKSIKLCLGVRETGTQVPVGYDGGTSGTIEFVGATSKNGAAPVPTRVIPANTWTTVDFDLANEPAVGMTGDGVLAPGKGVLEHLAIVPNGGTGVHNVYVDNFKVYASMTNFTVNTGEEIVLNCSATDADLPPQNLTFSLDAGAPTNATINEAGVFSWVPQSDQSPSTNVITIRVTDDGSPALSATRDVTIKVVKVNTPPRLSRPRDIALEQGSAPQTLTITNSATDDDIPANTLTFSLTGTVPVGASINATTGDFTWTPPTSTLSTNIITVRVTDNGNPPLYDEQQFAISIVPTNTSPTLNLGVARVTEPFANFESFANNTANGTVIFRSPSASATTSSYIDTSVTNYSKVTNSFPTGNANSGSKTLVAKWNFKTGTANYWVRLFTAGVTSLPNPTIDLNGRVKFDIYTTKALKVGLGVRETGTTADIGANGGTTGSIEWLGVTNVMGSSPQPNRSVSANTWTTLEFDLRNEPIRAFPSSGDGVLAAGKGVLEHLALAGNGGTGAYTVYLDNFQVVNTATLPSTVTMKTGSTLAFTATATDPNPGSGLTFGLDADFADAHTNAVINETTGAFSWTPVVADAGTTNSITVSVDDDPTNDGIPKSNSKTFTVIVNSDPVAPQNADGGGFVAGGESVVVAWASVPGANYTVQYKDGATGSWRDAQTIIATALETSVAISNDGNDRFYRVVAVGDPGAAEQ